MNVKVRFEITPPTPRPAAQRVAAQAGSTRLARSRRLAGSVRRRSSAVVRSNGGFATTLKGRLGNRRSVPSTCATVTGRSAKRARSTEARRSCSSMANTVAPARRSCSVMAPVPAPTSRTRSPGATSADRTSREIQRLSSWCHPHRAAGPATEHHHRRHSVSFHEAPDSHNWFRAQRARDGDRGHEPRPCAFLGACRARESLGSG